MRARCAWGLLFAAPWAAADSAVVADQLAAARLTAAAAAPPPAAAPVAHPSSVRELLADATHLDVGARFGGSQAWLFSFLKARGISSKPVGLDIDPFNVRQCLANGQNCVLADARLVSQYGVQLVRGVTLFHVLEHIGTKQPSRQKGDPTFFRRYVDGSPKPGELPTAPEALSESGTFDVRDVSSAATLFRAILRLPTQWLLMRGPNFDDDSLLRKLGFVKSFAAWRVHTCHFNTTHLLQAFLKPPARKSWLFITAHNPISNSNHSRMQPLVRKGSAFEKAAFEKGLVCSGAVCDQHAYDKPVSPYKPSVDLPRVYEFQTALALFGVPASGELEPEQAWLVEAHWKLLNKKRGIFIACATPDLDAVRDAAHCNQLFEPLREAAQLSIRKQGLQQHRASMLPGAFV